MGSGLVRQRGGSSAGAAAEGRPRASRPDGRVGAISGDIRGLPVADRLLISWPRHLRRSELAALAVDDVGYEAEGIVLMIDGKADREGAGARAFALS